MLSLNMQAAKHKNPNPNSLQRLFWDWLAQGMTVWGTDTSRRSKVKTFRRSYRAFQLDLSPQTCSGPDFDLI